MNFESVPPDSISTKHNRNLFQSYSNLLSVLLVPKVSPKFDNVWFEKRRSLSATWSPIFAYFTYGVIQEYQVKYYEKDANPQQEKTLRTAGTSIEIEDLKEYTKYCLLIAAVNENGRGGFGGKKCVFTDEGGEQEMIMIMIVIIKMIINHYLSDSWHPVPKYPMATVSS